MSRVELTERPAGGILWQEERVTRKLLPEPQNVEPLSPGNQDVRVILAIPMERNLHQSAFFGFAGILVQGWPLARMEYTRNDIARHMFAKFLVQSNYTHLMMLDSDHIHPPDIVQRLGRWVQAYPNQISVVGGLNFRRGAPFDPCAFVDNGDGKYRRMSAWTAGAIEVEALGTGSILIARGVFEAITQPWFGYKYAENLEDWPGTDMWFSEKCRQANITLWCDTTTTSPHIADTLIDESSYRSWIERNGAP